jgi:ADP-ribosyl-[dinitrogen reductase] hydrolase
MTLTAEDQALLNQARQLVLDTQNPSVAFLQRMLTLEYEKACELMRLLEGDVVTPPDATGWRAMAGSGALSPDDPRYTGRKTPVDVPCRKVERIERAVGALMGLAVGDAIGTTLEFVPRAQIRQPLTDMVGGGPFNLAPGQWTDDTSMALCLGESLLEHGFDMHDQLNRYLDWYENGYMSSTGTCFDIGGTTADALGRYRDRGITRAGSKDPDDAGNGSIMRLAPVVIYFQDEPEAAIHYAKEQSKTTHQAPECLQACQLMAEIMLRALKGKPKPEVLAACTLSLDWSPGMKSIAQGEYLQKSAREIRGTGYVVNSLEAAMWCFATTNSFSECVLAAANLGDDADTTAAVAGQIAGAYYRVSGIPKAWQERVHMASEIKRMAMRLMAPH